MSNLSNLHKDAMKLKSLINDILAKAATKDRKAA
ncbi:hypothetical protein CIFRMM251M_22610 [Citrobacter freundii]